MRSCKRCGHEWRPRQDEPPVQCPKCRSPYWDIPRGLTRIAGSAVKSAPEGVDRVEIYSGGHLAGTMVEVEPDEEVKMCSYTEYDGESGETMSCGLREHSGKVRHGCWRKI